MSLPTCPLPNGLWQQNPNAPQPPPRWYTIPSFPPLDFDICDSCFQQISSSPYAKHFQIQPPKPQDVTAVRCDFSLLWVRLAWLWTQSDKVSDLRYLTAVSRNSDPLFAQGDICPGSETAERQWYSLASPDGTPVHNWCACKFCVTNLVTLCPTFKGQFKPMYFSNGTAAWGVSPCAGVCDLGCGGTRSFQYLDQLFDAHVNSLDGRTPNLANFHDFVSKWSAIPICRKDNESADLGVYYTVPQISDFTVCPECYLTVIEPSGTKFAFTPQQHPRTWSCQLYSDRMRRVFAEANANDDIQFLRQKANERKAKENEVRLRIKSLQGQKQLAQTSMQAHMSMSGTAAIAAVMAGPSPWGVNLGAQQMLGNAAVEDAGRVDTINFQIREVLNEWKSLWE